LPGLAGQKLGLKEGDDGIRLATCYFELEQKTFQPIDNPFGARLPTYVSGWTTIEMAEGVSAFHDIFLFNFNTFTPADKPNPQIYPKRKKRPLVRARRKAFSGVCFPPNSGHHLF
jgi:hypothetical protein